MIRCTGVRKAYETGGRRVEAVRGVDLSIETPGFFGIMGRSGSGKSTLLHLLAGLDTPDEGTVEVAGERIDRLDDKSATLFRREKLGIVFQQFNLIPTMTARENVELPGMLAGKEQNWLSSRSSELLDRLGIGERAEHRPEALSGGEQQRVAIARALLFSPQVVLADEPTGALDSGSAEKLWSLLGEVAREQEVTVLMVTHEPAAAAHCETVFIFRDGTIAGEIDVRSASEQGEEGLDAAGIAARSEQLLGKA
ncbi:MAG: ABC transporter ATP-binding protein [Planctomycetota bacterium]